MDNNQNRYPSVEKPWLQYYSDEAINGKIPEVTLYEYLIQNNKDSSDRIAINYLGNRITYRALCDNILATAKGFVALGVKEHDIVTIALPSVPEALYAVYALNMIGAVANMIHPLAGKTELINYLREVDSEVCVIFEKTYEIICDSLESTNVRRAIVVTVANSMPLIMRALYNLRSAKLELPACSRFITWRGFIKAGAGEDIPFVRKNHNETAIISHTGGTTGEPKGVMCSDRNINALIWQITKSVSLIRDGRFLAVLPPFVNYSLVQNMIEGLALGFEVQLIPKYEPDKFAEYVSKYHPTYIHTIPAYLESLLHDDKIRKTDLSCLLQVFYGGEAMNPHMENAINKLLHSRGVKTNLGTGLGATETVSAATCAIGDTIISGSVGAPFPQINCKIVEPGTQNELSYLQEGEICFSGDTIMLGYYNNKTATDDIIKIHSDNLRWLHTGDLGYMNQDGILFVTGRIKRLIMTRDEDSQVTKIFPDRVEKVILSHPAIELCCVVGIPDDKRINYAKAIVLLKSKYMESEQLTKQILSLCRESLPSYMVPYSLEYRSSLPRTQRGKVDYRALEKEILTDNQ